ncbi:MAG: thiosulfate oxidation carrier protein SoxY [Hyphomicrobiaceae bacterium]
MKRRQFIKSAIACGLLMVGATQVAAIPEPTSHVPNVTRAFASGTEIDVLIALFGTTQSIPSGQLKLYAPFIATPGLGVQIKVRSDLVGAKAMAVVVQDAVRPLAAYVRLSGARSTFSSTLAFEKTSTVSVYVMTDHGVYSTSFNIKVSRGGYGTDL